MNDFLSIQLGQNNMQDILIAVLILFITIIFLVAIKKVAINKLKKLAEKTKYDFDDFIIDVIKNINVLFYLFVGIYIASKFIVLPEIFNTILNYAFIILLTYEVIKAIQVIVNYGAKKYITRNKDINEANIKGLALVIKIGLWVVAVILILSNLGYNVNSLVASLGIGGIAVALAVQNILSDIFCSFTIYLDKPFVVGDRIVLDKYSGYVKKIGIRTTRIETLEGDELVVSNKDLTSSRIRNYKKMQRRRIVFQVGVEYETKAEKLKQIPKMIKQIIDNIEVIDFARVHFKEFGDSSLIFEIVYYTNSNDYDVYMDKQQELNLAIVEKFEEEKINIAYPTQTVFIKK